MPIEYPQPKTFSEIIRGKTYSVPLFQRPYAWEKEQIEELWEDIEKNPPPYFLGILILRRKNKDEFEIIDGQQRLATLMLLLKAGVELIKDEKPQKAQEIMDYYLNQKDPWKEEYKPTLTLGRKDKEKFDSLIFGAELRTRERKPPASWKRLDAAINFFRKKLIELKREKGSDGIENFFRNQVTKLEFLDVYLESDSDVYLFFETLNDRGIDLSIADLVKNRVCEKADKQKLNLDDCVRIIDEISQMLSDGRVKTFLHHYCWANSEEREPLPRAQIMNWYNRKIESTRNVIKDFLEDLRISASLYAEFINPKNCSNHRIKEVLRYLKALDATRCYPLLLQGRKSLPDKDFVKLCTAVEILTFRHSTVLKRDAKILEKVYYRLAQELRNRASVEDVIKELAKQEALEDDKIFIELFQKFEPKNQQIARYVLWKIEEIKSGEKTVRLDWDDLTVEHILARALDWKGKEEYLERLGNLTLLSIRLNPAASAKPFEEKKEELEKEKRIMLTKELLKYQVFTKNEIEERQREFSKLAPQIWSFRKLK